MKKAIMINSNPLVCSYAKFFHRSKYLILDEIQTLFDVHFSQLKCQLKHHPLPPTPRCLFHPSSALRGAQYNCGYAEQ